MLLVVAYDVETTNPAGAKRLRSVAKLCQKYGVRVQNSVFEIETSAAQLVELKGGLQSIIDQEQDSIRIYHLGNSWQNKIEVLGKNLLSSLVLRYSYRANHSKPSKYRKVGAKYYPVFWNIKWLIGSSHSVVGLFLVFFVHFAAKMSNAFRYFCSRPPRGGVN